MRNATTYIRSLAALRHLDSVNAELATAESLTPQLTRALAHESRRTPRAVVDYTESDRAWFRRALGSAFMALAMACSINAHADTGATVKPAHVDTVQVASARKALADARDRLRDVRASERTIKAHAHDLKRANKLRADLAKVEAKLSTGGGK